MQFVTEILRTFAFAGVSDHRADDRAPLILGRTWGRICSATALPSPRTVRRRSVRRTAAHIWPCGWAGPGVRPEALGDAGQQVDDRAERRETGSRWLEERGGTPVANDLATLAALAAAFRKGAWTNKPDDPNYQNHWNAEPLQAGEQLVGVHPGTATYGGIRSPVNVRLARGDAGDVGDVDTPNLPRGGC